MINKKTLSRTSVLMKLMLMKAKEELSHWSSVHCSLLSGYEYTAGQYYTLLK